jgi:hypothetical protein
MRATVNSAFFAGGEASLKWLGIGHIDLYELHELGWSEAARRNT